MTPSELEQLQSQQRLGGLLGLSGISQISEQGNAIRKDATLQRREAAKFRKPTHLGQGVMLNPDGTTSVNDQYQKALEDEQARKEELWLEHQRIKDKSAMDRAEVKAYLPQKPSAGERKDVAEADRLVAESEALLSNWQTGSSNPLIDIPTDYFLEGTSFDSLKPVIEKYAYSPEQLDQRTRSAQLESSISKLMAGLALTGFELGERKKWSPFTAGMSDEQSRARLTIIQDIFKNKSAAIRELTTLPNQPPAPETVQGANTLGVEPEPSLAPQPNPVQSAPQAVGQPKTLSNGKTYQQYSDGSVQEVQ